jgi:hypothetical protein
VEYRARHIPWRFNYNSQHFVLKALSGCLVDVVAVMGDVFILVYNFHVPLCLKVKLSVQWSRL